MAAPTLREVRRRKGALVASAGPRALTAASSLVTDVGEVFKGVSLGPRRDWQKEAWEHFRAVGEFGYYGRWRAQSCSRATLVASEVDPKTGLPTGTISEGDADGERFAEMVKAIAGGTLGQAQLIRRTGEVLSVVGELWIAILIRTEGEGAQQRKVEKWYAVSREEIEPDPTRRNSANICLPDSTKHEFSEANGDCLIRVWNPDADKASEPSSPVQGVLDSLREIRRATKRICNADLSRLISAGILAIPSEASLPDPQAPTAADKPGPAGPAALPRKRIADAVTDAIVRQARAASLEGGESSLDALVPIVISMPGDHVDKIRHIKFSDEITQVALDTREKGIDRLAMGLDMSPETLRGLGSETNHWSSRMLADADVQIHVASVLELFCQAIYDNVLRRMLLKEGIDPDKYVLWYDTSKLTVDPDKTDEVKDAHEKGAATSAMLNRVYGLPDDAGYDLTTIEGYQQLARDKLAAAEPAVAAQLMREWMPLLDSSVQALPFPEPAKALPPGDDEDHHNDETKPLPDEPDTEDKEPRAQAASLRPVGDTEQAVIELFTRRALGFAGNRRVKTNDHEQRARLAGVASRDYHRFMPEVAESEVARLINGWDADLTADFVATFGVNEERVRAAVVRNARRELTGAFDVVDGQVVV